MNSNNWSINPVAALDTGWLAWLNWTGMAMLAVLAVLALVLLLWPGSTLARSTRAAVPTLRGRIMTSLLLVSTLPLISVSLVLIDRDTRQRLEGIGFQLEAEAAELAGEVSHTLDKNLTGMVSLASHIQSRGEQNAAALQLWLRSHQSTNPDLLTMLAADRDARIITATYRVGGEVKTFASPLQTISDRQYFSQPIATGLPFVSDVFQGRGLGEDAIVAISAPLVGDDGQIWGIVEGSLNLGVFARLEHARSELPPTRMLLLDEDNRVIYASPQSELTTLSSLSGHPLLAAVPQEAGAATYSFQQADQAGRAQQFVASRQRADNGWQVFVFAPLGPVQAAVLSELWVTAAWLGITVFVALVLTFATAASTSRPLRELERALDRVKTEVSADFPSPPHSAPREIRLVYDNIKAAILSMQRKNQQLLDSLQEAESLRIELSDSLASRDQAIDERTRELREANMTLHLLNRTDSLTGLANRQGFQEFLSQIWGLAVRESTPVSLICVDIDHFKRYNDHYGHPAGDRCLRRVAVAINDCAARPLDHVARNGGEEFVAVLGDTGLAAAVLVAERMCQRVAGMNIPHAGADGRVTISIGVASMTPERQARSASLLELADQALYAAKNGGRNRVAYADHGRLVQHSPAKMTVQGRADTEADGPPPPAGDSNNILKLHPPD